MTRTKICNASMILVGLCLLIGCDEDEYKRLAEEARQAADRQAQQNTEMGISELGGSSLFLGAVVTCLLKQRSESFHFGFHRAHLLIGGLCLLSPVVPTLG